MYRGRYRARTAGSVRAIALTTAILDRVTTAPYSAYSVRQLYSTYAGAALRVRRASDNAEQDIGFTTTGTLNTTSLLSFCAGTDGFVTTWYDQTGNTRHLAQVTTAAQGQIVSAGTLLRQDNSPALVFAAGQWMTHAGSTFAQPYSRSSVFQIDARVAGHVLLGGASLDTNGRLYQPATNTLAMDAGTPVTINTATGTGNNGQYTIAELYNGASSTRSLNGVVATISPGANAVTGINVNADYLGSSLAATRFTEVIFWNVALDATSRQTLTLNQRSYYTTP